MNSDQALRNLKDGLQTIIELAEGLKLDAEDLVNDVELKLATSKADLQESNEMERE